MQLRQMDRVGLGGNISLVNQSVSLAFMVLVQVTFFIPIIITTRPKPAYGRQGLAGSWGQDTDEVSTFLVFLTSHFAPAALSPDLNQPGTINHDKNPPRIMKTRPGAIKTNLEQ